MRIMLALLLSLSATPLLAAPRAEPVAWSHDGTAFSGFLVYDDATSAPRPGLVMVPNWMGVNASAVEKAKAIAGDRYVVLVADMYGKDVRPANAQAAGQAAGAVRGDAALMRGRIEAALATLKAQSDKAPLDVSRLGAFGFCFGGTVALELARAGADIAAVVSLHGGLTTQVPARADTLRARVLVLNGADDRAVTREHIAAFGQEMREAGADWQFVDFGGAVHCFAEADAGDDPASNCRYHAPSAARAYRMLHDFFAEAFAAR